MAARVAFAERRAEWRGKKTMSNQNVTDKPETPAASTPASGSAGWGLWDRGRKRWRTTNGKRQTFGTRGEAAQYKLGITRGIRRDPLIAYYRAFVSPLRLPNEKALPPGDTK